MGVDSIRNIITHKCTFHYFVFSLDEILQLVQDVQRLQNADVRRTLEKRVMLDIAASQQVFRDKVISDISFARSQERVAGSLTKAMSQAALRAAVSSGYKVRLEQWIIWSNRGIL